MSDPLLWLGISLSLLAMSLIAIVFAALPTLLELARVARSAEKLLDTLTKEIPPTLEALRLSGSEIGELSEDLKGGVKSAAKVVQQLDQSITQTKEQVVNVHLGSRSVLTGVKAAWRTFFQFKHRDNFTESEIDFYE